MAYSRIGKIARLPKKIRERVNLMLLDNRPLDRIKVFLRRTGYPDITVKNISNWKLGGHQDWLQEQSHMEQMEKENENAAEIFSRNEHSSAQQASLCVVDSHFFSALRHFDPDALKKQLEKDPKLYFRLVNALARLSQGALERQKLSEQKAAAERAANPPPPEWTKEKYREAIKKILA